MIKIINQPQLGRIGDLILEQLTLTGEDSFDNFCIIVSFAKKSGASRIQNALQQFRKNGGVIKAVVGFDNQGTTKQGLEKLMRLSNEVYVYHDAKPFQTFHPKTYIFEKERKRAKVYMGSSNLTQGGLFTNYETNVELEFNLEDADDMLKFNSIKKLFNTYSDTDDKNNRCKLLNKSLLNELISRNLLGDEEIQQIRTTTISQRESAGPTEAEQLEPLFGSETFEPAPPPYSEEVAVEKARILDAGFWKRLSSFDVSKKGAPGQIIIPIRFLTYFPPIDNWQTFPSGGRQADVFFNVTYIGRDDVRRKVDNVRTIQYVPAPHHPRPNQELRFTFRNRSILEQLRAGDILEFRMTEGGDTWFEITLLPKGSRKNQGYSRTRRKFGVI